VLSVKINIHYSDQFSSMTFIYFLLLLIWQGEDNLVVPIHAFPVLNTSEFPKFIDFSLVPLGEMYVTISSSCNSIK